VYTPDNGEQIVYFVLSGEIENYEEVWRLSRKVLAEKYP